MSALWKGAVISAIAGSDATASVAILDPVTGDKLDYNSGRQMLSASLIKLPVLWNLFERVESGEIKLDEQIVLDDAHRVDGGLLHKFSAHPSLRIEDYALLMCAVSDNSAANTLIDRLGMGAVNAAAKKLGMTQTDLQRKMLDSTARKAGKDNWTCADDVAAFYAHVLNHDGLSKASCDRIMDMLSAQKLQNKLAANIPCDDVDDLEKVLIHKTGELDGHEHDAGILFPFGKRPLIVVVMTTLLSDRYKGVALCSKIGRILYDAMAPLQA